MKRLVTSAALLLTILIALWRPAHAQFVSVFGSGSWCHATISCYPISPLYVEPIAHEDGYLLHGPNRGVNINCDNGRQAVVIEQGSQRVTVGCANLAPPTQVVITPTATLTPTLTPTWTATATPTPTPTATLTITPTATSPPTYTPTLTPTVELPTVTPTVTPTEVLSMTTYTSQPDATAGNDLMLFEANPTTNYATFATMWLLDYAANRGRGLLRFDLSSIPSDATVDSATLSLYAAETVPNNDTIVAHVLAAANVDRTEAGARWNDKDGTNAWAGSAGAMTSGTDYTATALGSVSVTGGSASGTEHAISLNTAQVEALLGGNIDIIVWAQGSTGAFDYQRVHSSDGATANLRPKLVINYTEAGGSNLLLKQMQLTSLSGGGLP